jgi:hypothetical protein
MSSTSTLSSSGRKDLVPAQEALDPEASRYNTVLAATRHLSLEFPREDISKALLLIEIEDLARNELKKIGEAVDKSVKSWNLDAYHREILLKPSYTTNPDTPDAFFSRHAGTKPRLILRLTGKVILYKVKQLLSTPSLVQTLISDFDKENLHSQIKDYIERWDKNIQFEVVEQAPRQESGQKKRQRG